MSIKSRYGMVIKYEDVAAMLANESSDEQSAFFNTFAKELRKSCGSHYHTEMQISYVRDVMDKEALEIMQWEGE